MITSPQKPVPCKGLSEKKYVCAFSLKISQEQILLFFSFFFFPLPIAINWKLKGSLKQFFFRFAPIVLSVIKGMSSHDTSSLRWLENRVRRSQTMLHNLAWVMWSFTMIETACFVTQFGYKREEDEKSTTTWIPEWEPQLIAPYWAAQILESDDRKRWTNRGVWLG